MAQLLRSRLVTAAVIRHRVSLLPSLGAARHRKLSSQRSPKRMREYYRRLNLEEGCSADDVRESFRKLAKQYHPDSGSPAADAATFIQIEEAYRAVRSHIMQQARARQRKMEEAAPAAADDEEENAKYKTPQHRHYLSFEGIGFGTPSQREKQYRQFRADRAAEQVLDYQKQKLHSRYFPESLPVQDVRQSRQQKITQAMERLVEDLIQESMARGDFDNLRGKGKPLQKFEGCSHIDPMTHNLNRILIDNGYQPEWILLQKEIKDTIDQLRASLVASRQRLGDPMTPAEQTQWGRACERFQEDLRKLNKRVSDFNLIVPLLARQKVHFDARREIARAQRAYEEALAAAASAGAAEEKKPAGAAEQGGGEKASAVKTGLLRWVNVWKFLKT